MFEAARLSVDMARFTGLASCLMAITPSVVIATQHMLRLLFNNSGGEATDTGFYTQAQLAAACAPGPLKALFTNPFAESETGGVAVWTELPADARLTLSIANGSPAGSPPLAASSGYNWRTVSGVNRLDVAVEAGGEALVELRYDHTIIR